MSYYYTGVPLMVTGGLSCPPPQDCCCDNAWELRPGDTAPRWIDVTGWMTANLQKTQDYLLEDPLIALSVTDLTIPGPSWPIAGPSPVTVPIAVGTYFQINKIQSHVKDGRFGYSLDIETFDTATINTRLRLDYKFKALSSCHVDYIGTGCVIVVIRKCLTGVI